MHGAVGGIEDCDLPDTWIRGNTDKLNGLRSRDGDGMTWDATLPDSSHPSMSSKAATSALCLASMPASLLWSKKEASCRGHHEGCG